MINAYSANTQSVATGATIPFTTNKIKTGCTVSHLAGSDSFIFNKSGYYYVTVNAIAEATAAETNPITIQLYSNGVAIPGAIASALSATATTPVDLSFTTIIPIGPSCSVVNNAQTITVMNTGAAATYLNASITITKLC